MKSERVFTEGEKGAMLVNNLAVAHTLLQKTRDRAPHLTAKSRSSRLITANRRFENSLLAMLNSSYAKKEFRIYISFLRMRNPDLARRIINDINSTFTRLTKNT